jgi:thioredoxin-dependent peroxiredoxin
MLNVGDQAPDIPGLRELRGKRVVLYFYPKADTPGCTLESCEFRDRAKDFESKGATVVGISPDKPAAQEKFKTKYDLPFVMLSDTEKEAAQAFGVWKEKTMYGKKVMGIERSTFVIGPDGKIEKIYGKVKAEGHAAKVLEEL